MARTKSNGTNTSTATIGFEGDLWLPTSTPELHASNFASLPGQLFYSTQIPVCLWFLAKNKAADAKRGFRDHRKHTLFIDARKLGTLIGAGRQQLSLN